MRPDAPHQSAPSFPAAIPDDPGLPNLGLALDPAQALHLLREADLPDRAASCRIQYIRYKPGTNCIVLYEVRLGRDSGAGEKANTIWVYAKLFARERAPRASDELLLSTYDADRRIAVSVFPRDLQIPSLRLAMIPTQAPKLLKGAVRRARHTRFHRNWSNWRPIRYKPERRCVMLGEYDTQDASVGGRSRKRFYARFYASSKAQDYARWYQYFQTLDDKSIRTPRYLGYGPKNRLLLLKRLPGTPLRSFFDGPEADLGQAVDAASAALATWHRLAPPEGTPVLSGDSLQLREDSQVLETLLPGRVPAPRALATALEASRLGPAENCLLHGDFYYDQVIVTRRPLAGLLDLDNLAVGDPIVDVSSFCAQLRLAVHLGELDSQVATWMCRRFIEGYQSASGRPVEEGRLQWHTSALLLKLAIWPFRRFQEGWPEKTCRIVEEACQWEGSVQC